MQDHLLDFLLKVKDNSIKTHNLILNGDIFDNHNFKKLTESQFRCLEALLDLDEKGRVIWIEGNHEQPSSRLKLLTSIDFKEHYDLELFGRKLRITHGDKADDFLQNHPTLSYMGSMIYYSLKKLDLTYKLATTLKTSSKKLLSCIAKVADYAKTLLFQSDFTTIICGHTHHPCFVEFDNQKTYLNSGSWVEKPCTLVSISKYGNANLYTYRPKKEGLSEPLERSK